MGRTVSLDRLPLYICATICEIKPESKLRRRLQDIGFVRGNEVICVQKGPKNNLCAFLVKGAVVALRCEDSKSIIVTPESGDLYGS